MFTDSSQYLSFNLNGFFDFFFNKFWLWSKANSLFNPSFYSEDFVAEAEQCFQNGRHVVVRGRLRLWNGVLPEAFIIDGRTMSSVKIPSAARYSGPIPAFFSS